MASTGQLVGSLVGLVVGSYFGFGQGGMALGGMIGLWIDPPDPPDPPPLGDLGINTYVRNMPVAIAYGQNKFYGGVIWSGNNRVEMENEGDKKNPQYSAIYYADFACAICEGTIGGFVKYMINDKDLSELDPEEDKIELSFTAYLGDGSQGLNPTIEAALISDSSPAVPWRWTAYVFASGKIGTANNLPTFSSIANALLCEPEEDQQANPVKVIYDFMTNTRYGMGIDTSIIDGSPTTSGSWKTAADYCDVLVATNIKSASFTVTNSEDNDYDEIHADFSAYASGYWDGATGRVHIGNSYYSFTIITQGSTFANITSIAAKPTTGSIFTLYIYGSFTEPRFRYANIIENKAKGYDFIAEVLQSCRGIIYYSEGLLKILIANADEVPVFYFSDGHEVTYTTGGSCSTTRLYADFSEYPEHYWEGDIVKIQLSEYYCEFSPVVYQTSTYVDICDELSSIPSGGISFSIRKENIIKNTFKYARKASRDRCNRFRTEFINRDDEFRSDYVEEDNVYDINVRGETIEGTAQLNGIKRKSQAARMNSFFLDFHSYVEYTCGFDTDVVGYFLTIGAIIGITTQVANWSVKLFRVISLEEGEDWTVKIECLEYIPTVFHDSSTPIIPTHSYNLPNPYVAPQNPTRFEVFEDGLSNKLYFCFNRPDSEPNWVGALLFANFDGTGFVYQSTLYYTTPSVKLMSAIDDADTVIPYDASTMYGSFPASGSFFIGTEEIYYSSINDIADQFEGCTRAFNNTANAAHADTEYCNLRQSSCPSITYDPMYIGCSIPFYIISVNSYNIYGDSTGAPNVTFDLIGRYYCPSMVSGLEINELGNGTELLTSTDCHIYWQSVTGGINKGYGFKYGDGYGYGEGELEGVYKYIVKIYKTADLTLLHEEEITDTSITDYNYTVAENEADNGGLFETNLTIKVYQINLSLLYSEARTIVTNV